MTFSPADGATNVAVGSNIVLTFSEAIQSGTGMIYLRSGSSSGTVVESFNAASSDRLSISGNTLTIDPIANLATNAHYYVTFDSGSVKDLAGNIYVGTSAYDFTTASSGSDDYADSVTDTTAPIGTVGIGSSVTGTIEIGGDHDLFGMSLTAGTAYIIRLSGADSGLGTLSDPYLRLRNSAGVEVASDDDSGTGLDSQLSFTPTVSGTYYVDAAHYSYIGTGTYQVSVSGQTDITAPTVSTFSPADGASNVAVGSNIVLTFSEDIQKGSGLIVIHSGSAIGTPIATYDVATSGNLSLSGNTLTINPTENLLNNNHYYVTFSAGSVKDLAGNSYAGTTSYDFTTIQYLPLTPMIRNGFNVMPEYYSGPATAAGGAPIHFQFIGDNTGEVVIGTAYNDFINVAGGVDAVNAGAGNDVIDGGTESNFLTGGAGTDIFFSDGRGGVTTWSTITDWQAGEQLSVWGWHPGLSRIMAWVQAGAAGYQGLTMHADLNGDGVVDTSVTFSGIVSQSQLPTPLEFDGVLWFV